MKKVFVYLLFLLLISSCNKKEADFRSVTYNIATAKVSQATSSEELVEISYALYLELEAYGNVPEPLSVVMCREIFKRAVMEKEVAFSLSASR